MTGMEPTKSPLRVRPPVVAALAAAVEEVVVARAEPIWVEAATVTAAVAATEG